MISPTPYSCGVQWRCTQFPAQPGKTYLVSFWGYADQTPNVRAQVGIGNTSGYSLVDRFVYLDGFWQPFSFVAVTPADLSNPAFRLIQCNGAGTLFFDDIEVLPVIPTHVVSGGLELGVGESVRSGLYTYTSTLKDLLSSFYIGNYSRCLYQHTAALNSEYYWQISPGKHTTFRHGLPGQPFTNATAKLTTYYQSGTFYVEFSADGTNWLQGTNFTAAAAGYVKAVISIPVPASLMPMTNVFTRLRSETNGNYIVYSYEFKGNFSGAVADADGNTWFFGQRVGSPLVRPAGFSPDRTQLTLELGNTNNAPRSYAVEWGVLGPAGQRNWSLTNEVPANSTNSILLTVPSVGAGDNTLQLDVTDAAQQTNLFSASAGFLAPAIRDASFGSMLPSPTNCAVWWCEGTYKVGRDRPLPLSSNLTVEVSAARNEYEPFQIVLTPGVSLSNLTVAVSDFTSLSPTNSASISATNVEVNLLEYVPVLQPSDISGTAGPHPDPMELFSSLTAPVNLPAGSNQPLWMTVYVPKGTPAGYYESTLTLTSDSAPITVPVRLRVFNFT